MNYAAPADYSSATFTLTFNTGKVRACFNISVQDDSLVENREEFVVMLMENDTQVTLDRRQASVQIFDNDGKSC